MATILDMGVLGQGTEILHPQMRHKWRVVFNGIARVNDSRHLTTQTTACDRPKLNFDPVSLHRYNSVATVAGKHSFEPLNMTFEADVTGRISTLIQQQLELQQKIVGLRGAPRLPSAGAGSDYKFSVAQMMMDGDNKAIEIWYLEGCYFEKVDFGDLAYSESAVVNISVTLRFDHARQQVIGYTGMATGGQSPLI